MGRLEKIVVLTVLFLVAVILGVSLNPSEDAAGKSPLASLESPEPAPTGSGADPVASAPPGSPTSDGGGPAGLLSTNVVRGGAPAEKPSAHDSPASSGSTATSLSPADGGSSGAQPPLTQALAPAAPASISAAPAAPAPFLLTAAGLEPSLVPEAMLYTWKPGDGFVALAERYYGKKEHARRLFAANEGRVDGNMQPGERIFVPVRAATAEERLLRREAQAQAQGQGSAAWSGGSLYVVQKGDVLGTISQKVYGTSKKWRKIFEANEDVLADPNALKVGMKLRIPE